MASLWSQGCESVAQRSVGTRGEQHWTLWSEPGIITLISIRRALDRLNVYMIHSQQAAPRLSSFPLLLVPFLLLSLAGLQHAASDDVDPVKRLLLRLQAGESPSPCTPLSAMHTQ